MRLPISALGIRRIIGFELKGLAALVQWACRRRDGVPPGSVAVPYAREQSLTVWLLLFATIVEAVATEVLLRAVDAPPAVRTPFLVIDLYAVVAVAAMGAAGVTRPHVVSPDELRIRYGTFLDVRVPRELIAAVRSVPAYNESGLITVTDGRLAVALGSQTNMVVDLSAPVTITRPLGGRAEVTTIRFFVDAPAPALAALRPSHHTDPKPA